LKRAGKDVDPRRLRQKGPDSYGGPAVDPGRMGSEHVEWIVMFRIDDLQDLNFRSGRLHNHTNGAPAFRDIASVHRSVRANASRFSDFERGIVHTTLLRILPQFLPGAVGFLAFAQTCETTGDNTYAPGRPLNIGHCARDCPGFFDDPLARPARRLGAAQHRGMMPGEAAPIADFA